MSRQNKHLHRGKIEKKREGKYIALTTSNNLPHGTLVAGSYFCSILWSITFRHKEAVPTYRHRADPVPGIHNQGQYGRCYRSPKGIRQLLQISCRKFRGFEDPEISDLPESYGLRKRKNLPLACDDAIRHSTRSWKDHRKNQWKSQ